MFSKNKNETITCRDWRKYSSDVLNAKLSGVNWNIDIDNVQEYWNVFENKLIKVVDELVPLTSFSGFSGNVVKLFIQ